MTEKEKAKAYDEAIERAKELYGNGITEEIFPELKESKDKKIREAILNGLIDCRDAPDLGWSNFGGIHIDDCIAWLEKQDKKLSWKPSKEEMDALYSLSYITNEYDEYKEDAITHLYQDLKREFFNDSSYENMFSLDNKEDDVRRRSTIQVLEYARSLDAYNQYGKADINKNIAWLEKQGKNSTDKTKPSFKVGDWIISSVLGIAHIIGTNDSNEFQLEYIDGKQKFSSIDYVNYAYDKWTINNVKDGDVLFTSSSACSDTFVFKSIDEKGNAECYFAYDSEDGFTEGKYHFIGSASDCKPATKAQCDFLMKAMKDARYEWDSEKKELKKSVEPKFKVGDKITNSFRKYVGASGSQVIISEITDDKYIFTDGRYIFISNQDSWELAPDKNPKFDPKTLNPFDKVLCKNGLDMWRCDLFSSYVGTYACPNVCLGGSYTYCIPYNDDTKHLVGTTDETSEYYKYWED